MVTCTHCQRENAEGSLICTYCGELIDPSLLPQHVQTRNLGENDTGENQPRWGTARFDDQTRLILRVTDTSHILHVDAHLPNGVILGRADPESGRKPEVDLTMFQAMEMGVSRRHARLDIHDESLYVTDLGSANSTYLNGLRLTAHQPRILRDSDEIRLGHLKLQVTFIEARRQTQKLQQARPVDVPGDMRVRDIAGVTGTPQPAKVDDTAEPELVESIDQTHDTIKIKPLATISKVETGELMPEEADVSKAETAEMEPQKPVLGKADTDKLEPQKPDLSKADTDKLSTPELADYELPTAELKSPKPDTAELPVKDEDETVPTARLLTDLPDDEAKVNAKGTASQD